MYTSNLSLSIYICIYIYIYMHIIIHVQSVSVPTQLCTSFQGTSSQGAFVSRKVFAALSRACSRTVPLTASTNT